MLKQRRMVAEQIAGALFEAEAAIDAAIAKTAALTGIMPSLRSQAGASALIGQDAVERASQAIMALSDARRAIVETHKELSIAKEQAIEQQRFETAAQLRDQERELREGARARSAPPAEVLEEARRRLGIPAPQEDAPQTPEDP